VELQLKVQTDAYDESAKAFWSVWRDREKTKKRPIEPVIDNVAAIDGTFKACEVWQDRFVGHGRVIKRERAGKETIAGNAMRVRRVNAGEHR
jgi:hypothetical protein